MINQGPRYGVIQSGVNLNINYWIANWVDENGIQKSVCFNINTFGYEVAKNLAIKKKLEMELSLNHYCLALHNLPLLELQELETNYEFREVEDTN